MGACIGGQSVLAQQQQRAFDLANAHIGAVQGQTGDADLFGTNLLETIALTQAQIDSAFYCEELDPPKLPADLKLPPTRKCDR